MEVAEIFMADFEEECVFANKYATIQLDCPEIYKPETPLPFHLVCVENDVSIAGATIDTSLHATTFPANLPSPISSEIFFGSPQASYDPCGSCKVKSEEDNDLAIHEQFIPTELNAIHNLWMEIPNDLSTLLQIERQPPKFTFAEVKDKYHVLEKIGEGTFSSVFKAISLDESMEIVALKRIYPTCSPQRILTEIKFLHLLGGKGHVAPLHRVLRHKDQVTLVLSNIEHMKFKDYLPFMTIDHIRRYMKALFEALQHLHSHNIIHRDLKPGNFLHNPNTNTFALVDFGLAQVVDHLPEVPLKMRDKGSHSCSPLKRKRTDISLEQKIHGAASRVKLPVNNGAFARDSHGTSKKSMRAPRGGTRGFRAPEVLMKCLNQTVAIDIWSAGVILLCILSTRYPFFTAPDDLVSLAEIGALFGTKEVKEVAHLLNRKITFPTDPLEIPKSPLKHVCNRLTSRNYIVPDSAFHLLERCLDLNPMTRITASEALKHPFLLICDTN